MKPLGVAFPSNLLLAIALLTASSGCASAPSQHQTAADAAPYRSVWATLYPATLTATNVPGTLAGDFHAAARAGSVGQARLLWANFLKHHDSPDGFYEDAMHARLCEWAGMEMQRLNFLLSGDDEAANSLAAQMQQMAPG